MFLKMYGGRVPSSLLDKSLKTIITTVTKISPVTELPTELIKKNYNRRFLAKNVQKKSLVAQLLPLITLFPINP